MAVAPGTRLGPYEVVAPLGAGGGSEAAGEPVGRDRQRVARRVRAQRRLHGAGQRPADGGVEHGLRLGGQARAQRLQRRADQAGEAGGKRQTLQRRDGGGEFAARRRGEGRGGEAG